MTVHFSDQDFQSAETINGGDTSANVSTFDRRHRKLSWQDEMVGALCRFVELPVGWDGYQGKPLRHDTGMFALQLMNGMMGPHIPSPYLIPVADGGIQIEWHQNKFDIELYIAAPYECELVVNDHVSNETKVFELTSDFRPLKEALRQLIIFNRESIGVANVG